MNIQELEVGALHPNEYNPNEMTEAEFDELVAEVWHLGAIPKPVVVRQNASGYVIIDGEHSWRAAQDVGLETLPCEVIEADDFEAMRQTYKRNQHGTHNPVRQGRMFREMMALRGLSQRELAAELEMSEGTIRNSLEYAKAADVRNDYAFERLSVKQVRAYNRIPQAAGDLWLACGANLKALYLSPQQMREAKLQTLDEVMQYSEWGQYQTDEYEEHVEKHIEQFGCLLELLPVLCRRRTAESFVRAVEKLDSIDTAVRKAFGVDWHAGRPVPRLPRETALPYLKAICAVRWQDDSARWAATVAAESLRSVVRVVDGQVEVVVPAEQFEAWVSHSGESWQTYDHLQAGLKALVVKLRPELAEQSVYTELWRLEVERDAPDYIRSAELPVSDKRALMLVIRDVKAAHGLPDDILEEAGRDAVAEVQRAHRVREEARKIFIADPAMALQVAAANSTHAPTILGRCIDEVLRKRKDGAQKELLSNPEKMVAAIAAAGKVNKSFNWRKGRIDDRPAAEVALERLSAIPEPELRFIAGLIVGDDFISETWFRDLGGVSAGNWTHECPGRDGNMVQVAGDFECEACGRRYDESIMDWMARQNEGIQDDNA